MQLPREQSAGLQLVSQGLYLSERSTPLGRHTILTPVSIRQDVLHDRTKEQLLEQQILEYQGI